MIAVVSGASPGTAQAPPPRLVVEALTREEAPDQLVRLVAEHAAPVRLGQQEFAIYAEASPRAVIERRCGSVNEAYIDALQTHNPGIPINPDQPLPAAVGISLLWPACVPTRGEGDEMVPLAVELLPTGSLAEFIDLLKESGTRLALFRTPPSGVITSTDGLAGGCSGQSSPPFDAARVRAAFGFSDVWDEAPLRPVIVSVVDNGIFGSDPEQPLQYGPVFRGRLATIDQQIHGPRHQGAMPDEVIFASNHAGDGMPVTATSGHGTHVAGLVLGGPEFLAHRDDVLDWLRLWIVNVGSGRSELVPNSHSLILSGVRGDGSGVRIVNLSIAYSQQPSDPLFDDLTRSLESSPGTLFVAAAGNQGLNHLQEGADVSTGIYPAAFGGLGSLRNVVTVGAHTADGRRARFSNFGAAVDILAPGCDVLSWLADGSVPAALSGTSQAAPIVSFTAAMLSALQLSAWDIKRRIFVSGDLLPDPDGETVASRSRLNIPRSLWVFHDYVEMADGSEWLGDLRETVRGVRCRGGSAIDSLSDVYSIKRGSTHWAYLGRSGYGLRLCQVDIAEDAAIRFRPSHRIDEQGVPQPVEGTLIERRRLADIRQILLRSRTAQRPE